MSVILSIAMALQGRRGDQRARAVAPLFSVGVRVRARFGGKRHWFPATIARVCGGDRYDVAYEDNDQETVWVRPWFGLDPAGCQ